MIANQAVQAGCHELEAVNELQVPYTEGHELFIRVGFPVYLAVAYLAVNLNRLPY